MKGPERRASILAAAEQVFSKIGYEKANVAMVCEEADIARGTLYQYFQNKNDLFRSLLLEYINKIREFMSPVQEFIQPTEVEFNPADMPYEEVKFFLKLRILLIFQTLMEQKGIFKLIMTEAMGTKADTMDLVLEVNRELLNLMIREITLFMDLGILKPRNPQVSANLVFGGIMKLCFNAIVIGEDSDLDLLAEQTADFCLKGLMG